MRIITLALLLVGWSNPAVSDKPASPAFTGTKAYCYFDDKALVWKIGNDAVERVLAFDRDSGGLRTVRVTDKKGPGRLAHVSGLEGEFLLGAEPITPGAPKAADSIRLDRDWVYQWQSVGTTASGGRLLTIHLFGKGRNTGYEAEAMYEVQPGDRPYLTKWLTLVNRSGRDKTVREVVLDRWLLVAAPRSRRTDKTAAIAPPGPPVISQATPAGLTLVDAHTESALLAAVFDTTGEVSFQNGAVTQRAKLNVAVQTDGGRVTSPKALVAAFTGKADVGAALRKLYDEPPAKFPEVPK